MMSLRILDRKLISRESVLEHVSRPVYLHFLDRELMTSLGAYDSLSESVIYEDLRFILLGTYEFVYLSTSLTFENKFARLIFKRLAVLFQKGHIQMALKESGLRDFVLSKRGQYLHAKGLYPFYFDDTWKRISERGPVFRSKRLDTSIVLENVVVFDLKTRGAISSANRLGIQDDPKAFNIFTPYAIEALKERKSRAVTKLLFMESYKKLDAPLSIRRSFDIKISEHYVNYYLSEYDGTVATGLSSGIEYFRYLCPTFPFHDIRLWRQLYYRLGCLPLIRSFTAEDIVMIRETPEFQTFVDEVRFFIARVMKARRYLKRSKLLSNNIAITEYLERAIRIHLKINPGPIKRIDDYMRVIEQTSVRLNSVDSESIVRIYQKRKSRKGRIMKNTVFVVYGRDKEARKALFELLRAAGLKPLEWSQIVKLTRKGTPYVGEVIDKGMEVTQAIVVLFTGDELVQLKKEFLEPDEEVKQPGPQPRPNVILEAGIALGKNPDRIIIAQVGQIREISDLLGRHVVRLDDSPERRKDLLTRLETAGCTIDWSGSDWMNAGRFTQWE